MRTWKRAKEKKNGNTTLQHKGITKVKVPQKRTTVRGKVQVAYACAGCEKAHNRESVRKPNDGDRGLLPSGWSEGVVQFPGANYGHGRGKLTRRSSGILYVSVGVSRLKRINLGGVQGCAFVASPSTSSRTLLSSPYCPIVRRTLSSSALGVNPKLFLKPSSNCFRT